MSDEYNGSNWIADNTAYQPRRYKLVEVFGLLVLIVIIVLIVNVWAGFRENAVGPQLKELASLNKQSEEDCELVRIGFMHMSGVEDGIRRRPARNATEDEIRRLQERQERINTRLTRIMQIHRELQEKGYSASREDEIAMTGQQNCLDSIQRFLSRQ